MSPNSSWSVKTWPSLYFWSYVSNLSDTQHKACVNICTVQMSQPLTLGSKVRFILNVMPCGCLAVDRFPRVHARTWPPLSARTPVWNVEPEIRTIGIWEEFPVQEDERETRAGFIIGLWGCVGPWSLLEIARFSDCPHGGSISRNSGWWTSCCWIGEEKCGGEIMGSCIEFCWFLMFL